MKYLAVLLALGSAGCAMNAQFAASKLDAVYPPRTEPKRIEMFRSTLPDKKYVEIGAVSSCCHFEVEKVFEAMRIKAADQGGDALIAIDLDTQGGASASVIRYQ